MTSIGEKLRDKSFAFALRIVKLAQYLESDKKEFVLSRQVLRSGTSVGANIRESRFAQSTADFIAKLHIALKEADETGYWLELLLASGYISDKQAASLRKDLGWIMSTLVNTTKKCKEKSSRPVASDYLASMP